MKIHRLKHILLLVLLAGLFGCDSRRVYEEYHEIPGAVWNRNNVLNFSVNINDTITPDDIIVGLRNKGNYNYSNIFLFITITSPENKSVRDTFECYLADETGKWNGSGLGDIYDNHFVYKKKVVFPKKGRYNFRVEQAMRVEKLEDISDVGLMIAPSK